jgi:heme/copper-type cytochrome/quinol oxidase subunit 2
MLLDASPVFYLDLNDDALIRDIVSGVYTGTPEALDIQNLYPFGALVSGLYRILPDVPWFGLLLFLLQSVSVLVILLQMLRILLPLTKPAGGKKRALILTGAVLAWAASAWLILPHFFFVQYSVTVGLMAAAAAFLIVSARSGADLAGGVVLVGIAYCIRSEMLLLLLPMILVALLFSYTSELTASRAANEALPGIRELISYPFRTEHYRKFGLAFIGMILLIALGWGVNSIGYAHLDWDDFVRFFDARTEVYDFTGVPDYDRNSGFYGTMDLSGEEVELLENYNFGLDDKINADVMARVASYASRVGTPLSARMGKAVSDYLYRLRHAGIPEQYTWPQTDAPWNLLALLLYLSVFLLSFFSVRNRAFSAGKRVWASLWQPLLLFAARTTLWMYILVRGRDPIRITHPLYFVEIAVLAGMLLVRQKAPRADVMQEGADREENRRVVYSLSVVLTATILIVAAIYATRVPSLISEEQERREEANEPYEELREYCAEDLSVLYFFDVYSSVAETRPLFEEQEKTGDPDNLDLLGGWAVKSPAWQEKLETFGVDDPQSALLSGKAYFVAHKDSDITWLEDYFDSVGVPASVMDEDMVADTFVIYRVRKERKR